MTLETLKSFLVLINFPDFLDLVCFIYFQSLINEFWYFGLEEESLQNTLMLFPCTYYGVYIKVTLSVFSGPTANEQF